MDPSEEGADQNLKTLGNKIKIGQTYTGGLCFLFIFLFFITFLMLVSRFNYSILSSNKEDKL